MKFQNNLFKGLFLFFFSFLVISYTFFDDGGISTKFWYDFLAIPVISAIIGLVFTSIFYGLITSLKWMISRFA